MSFYNASEQYEKANVEIHGSIITHRTKADVETSTKAFPEDAEYSIISRDGQKIYDARSFMSVVLTAQPIKGETIGFNGEVWDIDNWKSSGTDIYDINCTKDEKSTNRRTKRTT